MYKNDAFQDYPYRDSYRDSVFTHNDYNATRAKAYRSPLSPLSNLDRDNSYYFKDHTLNSNNSTAISTSSRKDLSSGSLSHPNRVVISSTLGGSIPRTPTSPLAVTSPISPLTPTHKMNGFVKPVPLGQSKPSLSNSKPSLLSRAGSRITLYGKDFGVQNSLATLGLVALLALVFGVLGIQLLLKLSHTATGSVNPSTLGGILNSSLYESFHEVAIALASVVLMINLSCVLVCVMQCYFAAKLVKVPQGEERAFKYLKECASTRFLAITGFFLSIPVYISAVILHSLMELKITPAIISSAIMAIGLLFCSVAVVQALFYWFKNKRKANENVPVFESKEKEKSGKSTPANGASVISQSELSTLV
ncbi:uncharacterized protein LOC135483652 [Lineus longissimus]|uniref:uncharacterized protein LOC135483652 n=1 Tax=Lineus longissimus TaxID=88925 RepID=UPI00315CBA6F